MAMNAGAYGGEIKDIIFQATVLTQEGEKLVLSKEELDY
jgi:UDP-N-acetylmuramate dehydrogenase